MEYAHFYPAMDAPRMVTLWTPINATNEPTFGFPPRKVLAICEREESDNGDHILLLQLSLACFLSSTFKAILKPFIQSGVVGQVMGGILVGPSALSQSATVKNIVFPYKSLQKLETISTFGCVFFLFLVGVKMDISMVSRSGKKAWIIGVSTFITPILLTVLSSLVLESTLLPNHNESLTMVALLHATTTFHGIASFLGDLNLLNSEVGRLALSSSMISGSLSYTTLLISFGIRQLHLARADWGIFYILTACAVAQAILIKAGMRPFLFWMVRRTPQGQPLKEVYICYTIILVLLCAFISEVCGQHTYYGPILFGITLPAGSILAATLTDKLDGFVSLVLLPLYFLACGGKTDLSSVVPGTALICALVAFIGALAKFVAAVLPCIFFFDMVFKDAAVLGLILSTIGVLDIQFYGRANQLGLIDIDCFSVMNASSIIITGLISPVVQMLYDPSTQYISRKRRTIQDAPPNEELRLLACVHTQEQVPGIINLLRISNPTKHNPIGIYLIHLRELMGQAFPLLLSHESFGKDSLMGFDSIINAFRIFERSNQSVVSLQPFTAIAPFATMHNDVCTLALDRRVSFIMLPFHRHWDVDGYIIDSPRFRYVNRKVLSKAPCSVGILINRHNFGAAATSVIRRALSICRVGVFFTGGPDDREALAYAMRITRQSGVKVTVVRFMVSTENEDEDEMSLDEEVIKEFKLCGIGNNRTIYKEENLKDSVGICNVIRSMENSFDLILVGRRYMKSKLMEWNEFPELGFIADILASEDFKGKVLVLVVQQHRHGEKMRDVGASSRFSDTDLCHQSSFTPLQASKKFTGLNF